MHGQPLTSARNHVTPATVTITDPDNPSKSVAGLPGKIVDKDELDEAPEKKQTGQRLIWAAWVSRVSHP